MAESNLRVLVVDDERPIRRFLRTSLEVHGYDIFEAADGLEALVAVVNHRPDLVILDLGLPELDGVEADAVIALGPVRDEDGELRERRVSLLQIVVPRDGPQVPRELIVAPAVERLALAEQPLQSEAPQGEARQRD
ncbi:response regulator, partial [bacterium]|nr:response regulator [bacterium]